MSRRNGLMCATGACLLFAMVVAAHAAGGKGVDRGVRFDSPGVLDLAQRTSAISGATAIAVTELAAADAERIFAAAAIGEDPPALRFSDDAFGCAPASRRCSLAHEATLVKADAALVKRDATRLTVTPAAGSTIVFVDWKQPTTKNADGDEETHWYLGRIGGYLRVEVQFGHDAPGNFLINPQNGKVSFVHNGADLVAPSPDGRLLLTWNALNAPLSLRVAALDAAGPRLVLQCAAPEGATRLTPLFKGWHGPNAIDFVIEIGEQRKAQPRVAASLTQEGAVWRLRTGDAGRLETSGFACRQAAPSN